MRLSQAWIVTMKDFGIFRRKRYILYSLIAGPLALSVLLPASILLSTSPGEIPAATLSSLLGGEFTIFIMLAGLLPSVIGAYSFIGEKVEKSLEPLLATPTTDSELLLGKSLAAFLPSIAATYVGAVLFMAIVDASTSGQVGHLIFPNLNALLILFPAAPLACVMSVEFSIIISSRVNDIRAAQQLGTMVILPLVAIFILAQTDAFAIDPFHLLIISGILLLADVALFYVSRTTFEREEILTKWK
jgi:ABC-2 type transport system permease protein